MKNKLALLGVFAISLLACQNLQSNDRMLGWKEIFTGADTACAFGDPYRFFVRDGSSDKIVIDFQEGGACWNGESCQKLSPGYLSSINPREPMSGKGMYDLSNEKNPVRNWTHVHIPYCTGDLHVGSRDVKYFHGKAFTVKHRGAINSRAVLDWVYKNYPKAKQVFVTGCSAGGYGSLLWTPWIARHYQNARVSQLGDSAVGIIGKGFYENGLLRWGAQNAISDDTAELQAMQNDITKFDVTKAYELYAKAFPKTTFSQFTTEFDKVQTQFFIYSQYGISNINVASPDLKPTPEQTQEWALARENALKQLLGVSNFSSFVTNKSDAHCILQDDQFYSLTVSNTPFTTWFSQILKNTTPTSVQGVAK
jgi:Pectinacetylesterase